MFLNLGTIGILAWISPVKREGVDVQGKIMSLVLVILDMSILRWLWGMQVVLSNEELDVKRVIQEVVWISTIDFDV